VKRLVVALEAQALQPAFYVHRCRPGGGSSRPNVTPIGRPNRLEVGYSSCDATSVIYFTPSTTTSMATGSAAAVPAS
jgi:hypothetical protein